MKNFYQYVDFCKNRNVILETGTVNDDMMSCSVNYKLKKGPLINFLILFSGDEKIEIFACNYATLSNLQRKNDVYEYCNNLNLRYSMMNFTMDDKYNILVIQSFLTSEQFDIRLINTYICNMINVMEGEYDNMMRVMWG